LLRRYLGGESPRPGGGKPLPYIRSERVWGGPLALVTIAEHEDVLRADGRFDRPDRDVGTHRIYFPEEARAVADRAKLFKSGGSQAVRLPREYRFEGHEEVLIHREGRRVVLEPAERTWSRKFLDLAGSAKDFPYPDEPPPAEPGPDFDE
jgi:antitoxin VapB